MIAGCNKYYKEKQSSNGVARVIERDSFVQVILSWAKMQGLPAGEERGIDRQSENKREGRETIIHGVGWGLPWLPKLLLVAQAPGLPGAHLEFIPSAPRLSPGGLLPQGWKLVTVWMWPQGRPLKETGGHPTRDHKT